LLVQACHWNLPFFLKLLQFRAKAKYSLSLVNAVCNFLGACNYWRSLPNVSPPQIFSSALLKRPPGPASLFWNKKQQWRRRWVEDHGVELHDIWSKCAPSVHFPGIFRNNAKTLVKRSTKCRLATESRAVNSRQFNLTIATSNIIFYCTLCKWLQITDDSRNQVSASEILWTIFLMLPWHLCCMQKPWQAGKQQAGWTSGVTSSTEKKRVVAKPRLSLVKELCLRFL